MLSQPSADAVTTRALENGAPQPDAKRARADGHIQEAEPEHEESSN